MRMTVVHSNMHTHIVLQLPV